MNGYKILSKEIYVALAQRKEDRRTLLEAQMSQRGSNNSSANTSPVPAHQQLKPKEPIVTLESLEPYSPETRRQMLGDRVHAIL